MHKTGSEIVTLFKPVAKSLWLQVAVKDFYSQFMVTPHHVTLALPQC